MPSKPPKAQQAPFQQNQQTTNTYGTQSIVGTPEAQAFLGQPLDFGDPTNVDPGVGRRTDLAEQEVGNRYNSAFNAGTPRFIREAQRARELREVQGQGAEEMQQAEYLNQQGNNQRRAAMTTANLGRYERLLPQIVSMGGTSNTSGFSTQFPQSQPGFWQRAALGGLQGLTGGLANKFFG